MNRRQSHIILLVMIVALMTLFESGCGSFCRDPVKKRPFKATELLLNESAFPKSWKQTGGGTIPSSPLGGSVAIERYEAFFRNSEVLAFHQVYRYSCLQTAVGEYAQLKKSEYKDWPGGHDWKVPAIASWAKYADDSYLACGTDGSEQRCTAIARYEEYVVEFYAHMSPTTFSVNNLQSTLTVMDGDIGRKLGK